MDCGLMEMQSTKCEPIIVEKVINVVGQGENATSDSKHMSMSKKLSEVIAMVNDAKQRLEDISIERRTEVSQKQWMTLQKLKSSPKLSLKPIKYWQRSMFARIYFMDKEQDDLFQNIMKFSSLFHKHLNELNDKMQCCTSNSSDENFENAMTQFANSEEITSADQSSSWQESPMNDASAAPAGNSLSPNNNNNDQTSNPDEEADPNDITKIRKSFTDLIRLKIEFDSQFLNFNGTLSQNCFSEDFLHLYKFGTNPNVVLGQTPLSIDKWKSSNKKLQRKRVTGETKKKNQKWPLRKSLRIASEGDNSEVRVIRSLGRKKTI